MVRRIGILGGTFDPIHVGHLAIAEDVRYALGADAILFVPAAQQPFKTHTWTTPADDRLAMARLAVADNPAFAVSDVEIRRGGLSYTVETVAQLRSEHPLADLNFIVGADAAIDLPRWFDIQRLLTLCRIVIVQRPGYVLDPAQLYDEIPALRERAVLVEGPALDVSATELRQRLRQGKPTRYHLPPAVREYIAQRALYRDEAA